MIKAEFYQSENQFCGFRVTGHAGFAESGQDIVCAASIGDDAKALLVALGMAPKTGSIISGWQRCYVNNAEAERCLYRGGSYNSGYTYGFASWNLHVPRTGADGGISFRSAYCKLPAA